MKRHLMLIAALLGFVLNGMYAQDAASEAASAPAKAELQFYPSPSIEIRRLLSEGETFSSYLLASSDKDVQLEARLRPLIDTVQSTFLQSDLLSISPATLVIDAGQEAELAFTVDNSADIEPGTYTGELELKEANGSSSWIVPIKVILRRPADARIYPDDENPTIQYAGPSFLNFLLPRNIRQESLHIRIDNESEENLTVSGISLALKGQGSGAAITREFLSQKDRYPQLNIAHRSLETLSLPFARKAFRHLPADEYTGEIRIFFEHSPGPLVANVTINKRMGAAGAILLLLLGIVVGRLIKGLDKAKGQMELMERFVPLRVKVDNLTEKLAQKQLWEELEQLEVKINTVQDDESKATVEALFPPLEQKIRQLHELEALHERLAEQFKEEKPDTDTKNQASQQLRAARDAILDGKEEEAQAAIQKLDALMEGLKKAKSKGILDEVAIPAAQAVKRQIGKLFESMQAEKGAETKSREPSGWERFFFRAMQVLSGMKMSARFRYGFVRPLVALATFIVLLLLGFHEIYINGGDTFGSAGIMDYMKLFLWGVVSDVFSRSLASDDLASRFTGKDI